jgi:hypothetical protein
MLPLNSRDTSTVLDAILAILAGISSGAIALVGGTVTTLV